MKIGVIGSGSIGPDLAYGFVSAVARAPGAKVYLVDIKQEALDAGVERIMGYAKKGLSRGKLSPKAAKAIEAALTPTLSLSDLKDCEYVLEAASEDLETKKKILGQLEGVVSKDCLIGFATSGLPRAQIAAAAKHPERCFVNHPFFPAWRSLPVEVVSSGNKPLEERMLQTLRVLGKVPIFTKDVACFAADDIFCNYISEAARIVEDGVATPAQVDAIVHGEIGGGGPFNVMDATRGNLLTVHCQELMEQAPTGTAWYRAPKLLTTQGNTPWHDRKNPGDRSFDEATKNQVMERILAVLLSRTYFVVDGDICAPTELNWMTRMALGFTDGLLEVAENLGADKVQTLCEKYAKANDGFPVPKSIQDKQLVAFHKHTRVDKNGDIAVLTVYRPEVKNALSDVAIKEIDEAVQALDADPHIKGIVFTGEGGALAGADIMGIASLKTPDECREICKKAYPVLGRMSSSNTPIVAALNGPVLGGGCEFSMACHARVVGPDLLLGQPEVNLGIIPGYGGSQRLPRLIGLERANHMLRTGEPVGAKQAAEWGWAQEDIADDVVAAATALLRDHIDGKQALTAVDEAPMSVSELPAVDIGHRSLSIDAILVEVMKKGLSQPLSEGLNAEAEGFAKCKATVDMDIGIKNFIQNGPRVPAAFLHE